MEYFAKQFVWNISKKPKLKCYTQGETSVDPAEILYGAETHFLMYIDLQLIQIWLLVSFLQLITSDADGAIQRAGRFRVENGSSEEVSTTYQNKTS